MLNVCLCKCIYYVLNIPGSQFNSNSCCYCSFQLNSFIMQSRFWHTADAVRPVLGSSVRTEFDRKLFLHTISVRIFTFFECERLNCSSNVFVWKWLTVCPHVHCGVGIIIEIRVDRQAHVSHYVCVNPMIELNRTGPGYQ